MLKYILFFIRNWSWVNLFRLHPLWVSHFAYVNLANVTNTEYIITAYDILIFNTKLKSTKCRKHYFIFPSCMTTSVELSLKNRSVVLNCVTVCLLLSLRVSPQNYPCQYYDLCVTEISTDTSLILKRIRFDPLIWN